MLKKIIKLGVIGENFINYEYDYNFFLDRKSIIYQIEFVENKRLYNYLLESIEEYAKKEQQVNKIIRQINKEDLFSLFERLSNISTDDTLSKSTNYFELFQYLYEIKIN